MTIYWHVGTDKTGRDLNAFLEGVDADDNSDAAREDDVRRDRLAEELFGDGGVAVWCMSMDDPEVRRFRIPDDCIGVCLTDAQVRVKVPDLLVHPPLAAINCGISTVVAWPGERKGND